MDANRRRELGKFILDLAKLVFGGSVVSAFWSPAGPSATRVVLGLAATLVVAMIGLMIVPKGS
jgi:hypothetical protein